MRLVSGLILCCLAIAACSTANEEPVEPSTPANTTAPSPGAEKGVVFEDDFETNPFPRW